MAAQGPTALVFLLLFTVQVGAREAVGADDAAKEERLSNATVRCSQLAELISCAEALNLKPNDPDLLVAEADALVQMARPGEAIGVFRNALRLGANHDAVNAKIATAVLQRRVLLDTCETSVGEVGRRACESAWLPGATDEVAVFKRRGFLLQSDNQLPAALDAYMAAARLKPADRAVALAIVNLSDRTGRSDAGTLAARGRALMTLRRPAEAIDPFREALRLAPELPGVKAELRIAESSRQPHRAERPVANGAVADQVAVAADGPLRRYSNDAAVTRTN